MRRRVVDFLTNGRKDDPFHFLVKAAVCRVGLFGFYFGGFPVERSFRSPLIYGTNVWAGLSRRRLQ